ncbi:hypothetical protein D3C72_2545910 [compost metagenome]
MNVQGAGLCDMYAEPVIKTPDPLEALLLCLPCERPHGTTLLRVLAMPLFAAHCLAMYPQSLGI